MVTLVGPFFLLRSRSTHTQSHSIFDQTTSQLLDIFYIYRTCTLSSCNFFFFHVQIVYISLNFSIPQTKTSSHRYFRTRISNKWSILCLTGISTVILFLFSLAFGLVLSTETGELMHQTIYTESVLGWPGREHQNFFRILVEEQEQIRDRFMRCQGLGRDYKICS